MLVSMYTIGILLTNNAIKHTNPSFFNSLGHITRIIMVSFANICTAEVKQLILWVI